MLSPGEIRDTFQTILGRPPENEAVVAHYAAMGLSAPAFARLLLDSEEVTERYRRRLAIIGLREQRRAPPLHQPESAGTDVLLFGAYGNGNLGDAAQADAVAALLPDLLPGALHPCATSWERRDEYRFEAGTILPSDAMVRTWPLVASGRRALIVIGGGGLLGAPHFPLHALAWVEWLKRREVPWALLGVGGSAGALAEPGWREAYRRLIAGAAWVGIRDASTLAAASAMTDRAAWFPDPILARALSRSPSPLDMPAQAGRELDAIVIPRAPNGMADEAANRAALQFRDRLLADGRSVLVVGMERALDEPALRGQAVRYVERWDELEALCRTARVVVSGRLHGVIAGLSAGCVVHGLLQPKIGDLLAGLGVPEWFAPDGWPPVDPDLSPAAAAMFRRAVEPGWTRMRARLAEAMRAARAALTAAVSRP